MNYIFKNKENDPSSLKEDIQNNKNGTLSNISGYFQSRVIDPFSNKTNQMIETT